MPWKRGLVFWRRASAVLSFVGFLCPGAQAQLEGDLDPTYGNILAPGRETNFFDLVPGGGDVAIGVALDTMGRAVTVGLIETADPTHTYAVGLARFTRTGQIDSTFGNSIGPPGTFVLDLASSQEFPSRSIEFEADGSIVFAASRYFSGLASVVGVFARIFADGSDVDLTRSFNLPATPLALPPMVRGFVRDAAGRYLAYGDVALFGDAYLARLTADFALDTAFGTNGWMTIDPFEPPDTGTASVRSLVFDGSGRMVAAVSGTVSGGDAIAAITRRLPSGAADPSFGSGGTTRVVPTFVCSPLGGCDFLLRDVVVAPSGEIFAVGSVRYTGIDPIAFGWLVRLSADGLLVDQALLPALDLGSSVELSDIAVDPLGRLVMAGSSVKPSPAVGAAMYVSRYDAATLSADPNFALGGRQEFDFIGLTDYTQPIAGATAITLDVGRPLVAGTATYGPTGSNQDFAVARLHSDYIYIFQDDFESGDVEEWSAALGAP